MRLIDVGTQPFSKLFADGKRKLAALTVSCTLVAFTVGVTAVEVIRRFSVLVGTTASDTPPPRCKCS
jgi:hypothetical protein